MNTVMNETSDQVAHRLRKLQINGQPISVMPPASTSTKPRPPANDAAGLEGRHKAIALKVLALQIGWTK